MSLQSDKKMLVQQVNRYMTLLSNLDKPPIDYIGHLDYFKGLVQFANQKEILELQTTWDVIKPKDERSLRFIVTGVMDTS